MQATLIPILFIDPFIGLMMVFRSQLYETNFFLIVHYNWGTDNVTKMDDFLEKESEGGGRFQFMLQILDL